ncbi:hypothetical protein HPB51_016290 [Rhipicephalus microplus]|uniref:Uncharacterized protein n=1 Tax=Rhipicephalus microplus TaxID=6941 RepID=A0A9J6ETT6_RHIMP|nr:hypothetical protein HPB51_016290 [Rhipicephalus microplus]
MYRPSQTPRLTLSSEQVAQAQPAPRRETEGPSLGARSVDNTLVRFPLHRMYRPSQTPRLTLSSEQVAQAQPAPRRETEGPSLGARSVDNTLVRFPLHRSQTRVKLNRVFFPR